MTHESVDYESLNRRSALGGGMAFAALTASAATFAADGEKDSRTPAERLTNFLRATGDISGAPSVSWASGSVYAWVPGIGGTPLFDFSLFGVQRLKKTSEGWLRLSREAGLYLDRATGAPLVTWRNPFTERDVEVAHLNNNPSNVEIKISDPAAVPEAWLLGDTACFIRDVFVTRPADMKVADYPLYAQSDVYKFCELYHYFASRADLAKADLPSVLMVGSNTRVGNWFPWMQMGQRRGWLISQVHSKKLASVGELPPMLIDYWQKADPGVFEAPTAVTGPNESSWSSFKKRIDAGRKATAVQ